MLSAAVATSILFGVDLDTIPSAGDATMESPGKAGTVSLLRATLSRFEFDLTRPGDEQDVGEIMFSTERLPNPRQKVFAP